MASRILGMGDMMTLIERAQAQFDEEKAQEVAEKIKTNTFDFNDFIEQMDQVNKMGSIKDILKMIPGLNKIPGLDELNVDEKDMAHIKAIICSMTKEERANPDILSQSRRRRIAKGSGQSLQAVNQMISQFNQSRQLMNQMSHGKMGNLQKMMNQLPTNVPGMGGAMPDLDPNAFKTPEQLQEEQDQKRIQRKLRRMRRKR